MPTSSSTELWEEIGRAAGDQSPLWGESLLEPDARDHTPVFSPLADDRFVLGIETIYEGYLAHYARPRLFAPANEKTALLLGDYLYAHGLVRIAEVGSVEAVRDLAELISLCSHLQASAPSPHDGVVWAATAALLGSGMLDGARAALRDRHDARPLEELALTSAGPPAVERALRAHAERLR